MNTLFLAVLLNCGYDGAMAVWHHGFLGKCHQIAVALRVSYGGRHNLNDRGRTAEMVEDCFFFFLKFSQWVVLGWPDPTLTRFLHAKGDEQHEQEQQHANSSGTTRTLRSTPHHDGNDGELHRDDNPSTTHTMNRGRWRRQRLQSATATWFWFFLFFFCCWSFFFVLFFFLFDTLFLFLVLFFFCSVQPSSKWFFFLFYHG